MRVFYSWQMDSLRKVNKDLIAGALKDAINKLNDSIDLSVASREENQVELDQDTQGVLGSPPIAQVIFDKIRDSDVIVADVSLVASGKENRRHINSNVAIELGYTLGIHSYQPLLKVMNTIYGGPEGLPFDLKDRRHPVQYSLHENASRAEIASCRKQLGNSLYQVLKLYYENEKSETPATITKRHVEIESTENRARFWNKGDFFVPKGGDYYTDGIKCDANQLLYFRTIPLVKLEEMTSRETEDAVVNLSPLSSRGGFSRARNKLGAVSFSSASNPTDESTEIRSAVQIFKNREIWAVDPYFAAVKMDEYAFKFMPTRAVKDEFPTSINAIRRKAESLGYGERYIVELGLANSEGLHLAISQNYFERFPGPIFTENVIFKKEVSSTDSTASIFNSFVEKLFDEAGRPAPDECLIKEI